MFVSFRETAKGGKNCQKTSISDQLVRRISLQIINLIISISKYHLNLSHILKNSQIRNTKSEIIYMPALLSPKLNTNPSYTRYY